MSAADRAARELLVESYADLLLDAVERSGAPLAVPEYGPAVVYSATVRSLTGIGLTCHTFDRGVFTAWLASAVLTLIGEGGPAAPITIDLYGPRPLAVKVDTYDQAARLVDHLTAFR